MSVAMVNENKARLEDVKGDLDQNRHWVATQVGGPGQQMLCNSQYYVLCIISDSVLTFLCLLPM